MHRMSGKYSWKDLAGTAKKWVDSKVTETTTADRHTRDDAAANQNALEDDLEEQAGGALLTTLFPGLGRAIERQEDNRRRADLERRERDRADREASVVPGSSIELSGALNGRVTDVAVHLTPDDEHRTLLVVMEPVDPAPLDGGVLAAAGFAITDYHGEGSYPLVESIDALDPGVHHVALGDGDDETDWYYWSEEYGPARAEVGDGLITVTMPCRNCGSDNVDVTLRVPLP
jgi:hypothetical protein